MEEDIVIKQILIGHNPDDRRVDSELLIHAVENIMLHATEEDKNSNATTNITKLEVVGTEEPLGQTIFKISQKMRSQSFGEGDLHKKIMLMFDMLQNYKWEAKLALILAAFATSYGEFRLLMQQFCNNSLAQSISMLKPIARDFSRLKPQFKSLQLLVESMVNVTKSIVKFEGLPLSHVELGNSVIPNIKSSIYLAAYWVVRSTLICSSHITDLIFLNMDKNSDSMTTAIWELSSLTYRLSNLSSKLEQQVESCSQQIDVKLYHKLLNLVKRSHVNNQEVLHLFFALNDDFPLKQLSKPKTDISELKNKVVMLYISKPDLLPSEDTLFLVEQAYNHSQRETLEGSYEMVWIPISLSNSWTDAEERSFEFLSNLLPWYSVRQPWLINSQVVRFIKEEWRYRDEPIMVVLDENGMVSNLNAIDMTFIWGSMVYPFSVSKEQELWEAENSTLQLLLNHIDPFLTKWVEEGGDLCIHGSKNLRWIQQFIAKMKEIKGAGVLKIVYVGLRNAGEDTRTILAEIENENMSNVLSFTKIGLFWLRLESIRKSIQRLGKATCNGQILEEVSTLLDIKDKDPDWMIIGRGNSSEIIKLEGIELMECLDMVSKWKENIEILGVLDSFKCFLESTHHSGPCGHSYTIPYAEGPTEEIVICDKCKHLKKKYVVYA